MFISFLAPREMQRPLSCLFNKHEASGYITLAEHKDWKQGEIDVQTLSKVKKYSYPHFDNSQIKMSVLNPYTKRNVKHIICGIRRNSVLELFFAIPFSIFL